MEKENCNAKHDGCCFVDLNCWNAAVERSGITTLSSLPIWQAEKQQHTTSFCIFFFLVSFVEWLVGSSVMKIKGIYHSEAKSHSSLE